MNDEIRVSGEIPPDELFNKYPTSSRPPLGIAPEYIVSIPRWFDQHKNISDMLRV